MRPVTREPFRFTTGRWFNKLREDGGWSKAPAYREGFTYDGFAYGTDTPEDFTPADSPLQASLICSRSAQFLAVDVDYPEHLAASAAGQHVSWADAISTRGSHFHVGIDMREVAPEDWPVQGRTAWGDVKAAGFIPVPGCVHYSGEPYAASPGWESRVIRCTPELAAALRADRDEHALRRLAEARQRLGLSTATRLPDGSYLYASGYVGGSWRELPDLYLSHDDELKDLVWDMHVEYGLPYDEVYGQWCRLAGALGRPWTDKDFARHWHRVPARRLERLEQDDAYRFEQDFGLRMPEHPVAAAQREQQQAYEQAPPGRPAPPPDWGFEVPGTDYFSMWLGTELFDAGRPTDADNAMAVLRRSHAVLRYDEEAGTWLLRGTGRWSSFTGAAGPRAVVNGLRDLMPDGCGDPLKHPAWEHLDAEADAGTIAALKAQAKNKERFSASSTVGAVAAVMSDTVLRHRGLGSTIRASQLDAEREVLWAGGVPWDLRASGNGPVMAQVDRSTPHLMTAPCVPGSPADPTPLWDAYCKAVFPDLPPEWGDKADAGREWALDVFAAAFTGYADAIMPVLLGETRLGKTFLVNLLTSVLGDYGGVMSGDLLKADARLHGSFTLKLKGMRLAFVDEAPGKGKASQEHLKKITGGGKMEGNKMRENPVEFFPTHTLVLAANMERPPELTDPALRARARIIKFEGDRAAVKAAAAALGGTTDSPQWHAEMPGVLAKMMARAAAWLADRSIADTERAPRLWQTWADDTLAEQDPVQAWLGCGEIAHDQHGSPASSLHEHFVSWCKRHGEPSPLDRIQFGIALAKAGYASRKSMGVKWWPLKIVPPSAVDFLRGGPGYQGGTLPSPVPPTLPPTVPGSFPSSDTVDSVVRDSRDTTTHTNTHNAHTHTHTRKDETGVYPSPSLPPSLRASDLQEHTPGTLDGTGTPLPGPLGAPGTEPVVVDLAVLPEIGENAKKAKNASSPPGAKTPRTRLTDEEKAARELARKAQRALDRQAAREAKIAELGGPLVQLPAVVLRDQSVLECTPAQASAFLSGTYARMGVDVEHSGFPIGHPLYRLRLVQLGCEAAAVVLDPSDPEQAQAAREALRAAQVLHAHSALADLTPLVHAGLADMDVWGKMTDTVILAKLSDPALCDSDEAGLKALARKLLGDGHALSWKCDELRREIFAAGGWLTETEMTTPLERSGWAMIPMCEAFVRYAASDVMDCCAVARVLS